ncbi:MAG TPA: DNA mismatch repair endonuclease MutL [Bacteroidales bacterium]|jgi:DNA mismatch repair protein MutL|nr:DNA mismatch repair endonuclease MutL [Bacteroidales bacterium]
MPDIIQLLPDSVANQIAAGEVVQRPASVVKELVENSIDAEATDIIISIIDAGRTVIQITDNGKGMSDTDARMAFERHATSKIRTADDIFSIRSMGFRGEALASIAAVSHTELKTRTADTEIGTKIIIKASQVESQTPVSCPIGSTFTVKNLFYNIPARRKFLKSNQTEFKYILSEILQIALAHPHIGFTIYKDDELYAKYPISNHKQRIVNIFGKRMEKSLLPIEGETSIVTISGYIGTPDIAKKNNYDQYFFVNNRFFRQKSYQNAIMRAYEQLIPNREYPPFFVFFDIDPSQIDVNIHPTKTEIKFVEEYNICQLLEASVKHALGKSNIVPSLDFIDTEDYSDMFAIPKDAPVKIPGIDVRTDYNPFKTDKMTHQAPQKQSVAGWEQLFEGFETHSTVAQQIFSSAINTIHEEPASEPVTCMQIQKKYILTTGKTGLMIIDIKRAHSRILYEKFLALLQNQQRPIQRTLLPVHIELSYTESQILQELLPYLQTVGFDIELFGQNSFVVNGTPPDIEISTIENIIHAFISEYNERGESLQSNINETIARSLAQSSALYRNPVMQPDEMQTFIAQLFQCSMHSVSADGKRAVVMLEYDEIFKKFNT